MWLFNLSHISIIISVMEYILIVYLFEVINIDIVFYYKLS
jgi:hypothetical protein